MEESRLGYRPIRTYRFREPSFYQGVEVHELDGVNQGYRSARKSREQHRYRCKELERCLYQESHRRWSGVSAGFDPSEPDHPGGRIRRHTLSYPVPSRTVKGFPADRYRLWRYRGSRSLPGRVSCHAGLSSAGNERLYQGEYHCREIPVDGSDGNTEQPNERFLQPPVFIPHL